MPERYLPVSDSVYDAIMDLRADLQKEYGDDVSISDTVDFLGHQYFVHVGLLDIVHAGLETMMSVKKDDPSLVERAMDLFGLVKSDDATCFIRPDIGVPFHWMHTRWLLDFHGKNILKCVTGPEEDEEAP
jgi:hypothetical protein